MLDKEEYKRELIRMWDSLRTNHQGEHTCAGVQCEDCPLYGTKCGEPIDAFEIIEAVEEWSKEHPPKKFKVSKLEYDILELLLNKNGSHFAQFMDYPFLMNMVEKGYFEGASRNTYIDAYIDSCEVADE